MTFKRNAAGTPTDIATTVKRKASSAWTQVGSIKRRLSGAWVNVWSATAITDQIVSSFHPTGSRTAGYRLKTSGIAESRIQASYSTLETWLVMGASSGYEVRATLDSGDTPTGTTGSWLALSSSCEWSISATTPNKTCTLLIEIRTTDGTLSDSATIVLEAGNI